MRQKDFVLILGSICIFTIVWIIFQIYHNASSSTIPEQVVIDIAPISPNFDLETIELLKKREHAVILFDISSPVSSGSSEISGQINEENQ